MTVNMAQAKRVALGETQCHMACSELEWTTEQVETFQKLVIENYGYKMFLDDLPSATTLPGSELMYSENIPLGYVVSE